MFTGRSLGGDQEPSFPKRSGEDANGGGACGQPHRSFSFDRRYPRPSRCSLRGKMFPTARPAATRLRRRVRLAVKDVQLQKEMTSAVALCLEREDVSDGASGSDEAEAARPPAGALQM